VILFYAKDSSTILVEIFSGFNCKNAERLLILLTERFTISRLGNCSMPLMSDKFSSLISNRRFFVKVLKTSVESNCFSDLGC
jgi:hypothetical protein